MHLPSPLLLVAIGLVILLAAAGLYQRTQKGGSKPRLYVGKRLMTANELEFYHRLTRAAPRGYVVLSQVAMSALLTVKKGTEGADRMRLRNRFDRKIVDFALLHADSGDVAVLIELDDRTHDAHKDAARDAITRDAGYRTLRFESRAKPDNDSLRGQLARSVSR
jgi:hypothetical protein